MKLLLVAVQNYDIASVDSSVFGADLLQEGTTLSCGGRHKQDQHSEMDWQSFLDRLQQYAGKQGPYATDNSHGPNESCNLA